MSISNAYAFDETLADLGGRIEYAFYAADSRSLLQSLQVIEKLDVATTDRELHNSYLNYGRWKLAQLLVAKDPPQAVLLAQACAESTPSKNSKTLAVHRALTAACLGILEELRPLRSVLYRREREAALTQAVQLGGKLAQVQFIAAWIDSSKTNKDSVTQDRAAIAHVAIKQAVDQYALVASSEWGYAEACYLLGKAEFARGNALAARNALEQALVLAPDYRDARQLLQSLNLK